MPKACNIPTSGSDSGKNNFAKTSGATRTKSRKSYASIIVPTVLATIARRNCRLCSASESWLIAIPVVVIRFLRGADDARLLSRRLSSGLHAFVLLRNVLVRMVRQHRHRDKADHPAAKNVEGNREARSKSGEQRRRDKRRGAAGDDRGQLITERSAAVTQAG